MIDYTVYIYIYVIYELITYPLNWIVLASHLKWQLLRNDAREWPRLLRVSNSNSTTGISGSGPRKKPLTGY